MQRSASNPPKPCVRSRAHASAGLASSAWVLALLGCVTAPASQRGEARELPPLAALAPPASAASPSERRAQLPAALPDTLEQVLERIARANPGLAAARERVAEARAAVHLAAAAALPELGFGLDFVSTDNPAQAFGLLLNQHELSLGPGFDATPGATQNWHPELRVEYAILAPGRSQARAAADEGRLAAEQQHEAARRMLLNSGVQAWIALRAARALECVAGDELVVLAQRLELVRAREREGAALRADALRFEVRLAEARQRALAAGLAVEQARNALAELMGGLRCADPPSDELLELGAGLPEDPDGLRALARARRADLAALEHRTRMLAQQAAGERAQRAPVLSAFGVLGFDGEDFGLHSDTVSYALGLGLHWAVSARTPARIRAAEARERAARLELAQGLDALDREVLDASSAWRASRSTLGLAAAAVASAEEAFRIVAAAQDAGAATATDVLEAAEARRSAHVRAALASAGVELARARLVAATGGIQ